MNTFMSSHASSAKTFFRTHRFGTLSTHSAREKGFPFGSLIAYDVREDGTTSILISDLSEHYKNLKEDSKASIFVADPRGSFDPQSHSRITVCCNFTFSDDISLRESFFHRHKDSVDHSVAHTFHLFTGKPLSVRWIEGFGSMSWIKGDEFARSPSNPLAEFAEGIIDHMNLDHSDALSEIVKVKAKDFAASSIQMVGINTSSITILLRNECEFRKVVIQLPTPATTPEEARSSIISLLKECRG